VKTNKAKVMKVLLIGQNYASVINSLSIGFDQIEGIKARAISLDRFTSHYNNYGNYFYKTVSSNKGRIPYFLSKFIGFIVFLYLLIWCDLVHVYFLPSDTESKKLEHLLINLFCRRKVVTFMGSEVRVPQIASMKNPYFSEAYSNPLYEYKTETLENSHRIQELYASDNYKLVIWDVESYIDSSLFNDIRIVPHASINSFKPEEITLDSSILVVHSPSAPIAKGTAIIKAAMEEVISNFPNVTFKILEGISNSEYQRYLAQSDILVDQMVWGGYGVAAQQAMEMGKIVCAYFNEDRKVLYGPNCPIVNITKETFFERIEELILQPGYMKKIKEASVRYYQDIHHPKQVANKMKSAYLSFFYGN
jgi:hypothetical protein